MENEKNIEQPITITKKAATRLKNIMNIGDQPLANSLISNLSDENSVKRYPINIIRCAHPTNCKYRKFRFFDKWKF